MTLASARNTANLLCPYTAVFQASAKIIDQRQYEKIQKKTFATKLNTYSSTYAFLYTQNKTNNCIKQLLAHMQLLMVEHQTQTHTQEIHTRMR